MLRVRLQHARAQRLERARPLLCADIGALGRRDDDAEEGDDTASGAAATNGRRKKRKKNLELVNFYRFQMREAKRERLAALRQRFEEDKARIAKMKAARKFMPF